MFESQLKQLWIGFVLWLRKTVAMARYTSDDWLYIVGTIVLILLTFGAVVAAILAGICFIPFLLIWATNTIAPVVGSTLVIPYSIPLMVAIAIMLWVLRSIFRRTVKVKVKGDD